MFLGLYFGYGTHDFGCFRSISTVKSRLHCSAFALALLGVLTAQSQETTAKSDQVTLKYLGTAGWEISDGTITILIDPYLSRINGPAPPGGGTGQPVNGDTRRVYGWQDLATPDIAAIDSHIPRADFVLVTHTHYDHILDVPHIALKTRASVVGTESTENVMRAYSVPEEQLLTVRGGEDYDFGSFSLKVIPSIHSPLDHKHYFSSAMAPAGMKAPLTLEQIHPEGGTLAYLIRFHGHQILAFGGMNYIEREIAGLKPDVALVGAGNSRKEVYDYSGRLMRALGYPAIVIPTHWDNFLAPYGASQQPALDALRSFIREIAVASPKTKVIVPNYFEPIVLESLTK
jgi:L-ascorbate metabolism protein UlaG (beta-lactamase superfamily)